MRSWIEIDTAAIPGSADTLRLLQRGDEFAINIGREMLMGSRMRGSEQALARLGCAPLAGKADCRVLVGGFGMGFTLRAALDILPPTARVVIAELVPAVLRWGRGPLAALSGGSLGDLRVSVVEGDVGPLIRSARADFDAILLDVDNGPDGLTQSANDSLYDIAGLRAAWEALRRGGRFCVWSAARDDAFTLRLRRLPFDVGEETVRAHGKRGTRHTIWVATRRAR